MEGLNLNIEEYNQEELEDILSLEYPYQSNELSISIDNLRNKLTSDTEIDVTIRSNIENFLERMYIKLESIIKKGIKESIHKRPSEFSDMTNKVYNEGSHFLIENKELREQAYHMKEKDKLNIAKDGGAPPGLINPIAYSTIKRALNIDSRFRPNYYKTSSSDQKLDLPYKFENVINMRLASIEIPLTYYAISRSYGNNTFFVGWDIVNDIPENIIKITIPDGNYETFVNSQTGAANIESIVNAALQDVNQEVIQGKSIATDPSFNLVYTVDHTSGRSIFSYDPSGIDLSALEGESDWNGGNKIRYKLIFGVNSTTTQSDFLSGNISHDPLPFYLGWQIGYRTNIYDSGAASIMTNIPGGGTGKVPSAVVSEGLCYIKGPQYLFVAIDDYNNNVNNYYVSAYTDSINNKNIIARINLASIQQSNGVYQTGEDDGFSTQINRSRNYFGPVNIEKLRITLYDEYGRIVNLNNMDWSCALMFEQVYNGGKLAY